MNDHLYKLLRKAEHSGMSEGRAMAECIMDGINSNIEELPTLKEQIKLADAMAAEFKDWATGLRKDLRKMRKELT